MSGIHVLLLSSLVYSNVLRIARLKLKLIDVREKLVVIVPAFKCVFDPAEDPVNAFLDEFVLLFKDQIADALKEPLQETLNSIIPGLPFPPSACESGS